MVLRIFVLKVTINERKILIHYEIIDRMAEQIESVINEVRKNCSQIYIAESL